MTFAPGQVEDIDGFTFRIRQGRKGPNDLVLDLWNGREYAPVPMGLGGLMADFFYQNEERLYPQQYGFDGGERYLRFLRDCTRRGWRDVLSELKGQKLARQQRDEDAA